MVRCALTVLLLLFVAPLLLGKKPQQQEVFYHQFEKNDGLLSNTVYDINLNENGEILFGTDRGLSIYNGLTFNSQTYVGASNALSDVFETKSGEYVGTNFDWEYVFFRKNKTEVIEIDRAGMDFPRVIPVGEKRLLYIKNGLISIDFKDTIMFESSMSFLYHVVSDNKKTWFTAGDLNENVLYELDVDRNLTKLPLNFELTGEDIPFIYKGELLFYRPRLNSITNGQGQLITALNLSLSKVNKLYVSNEQLFFATLNGLRVFNMATGTSEHYFESYQISDVQHDIEGNLWCSTLLNGVFMVPALTRRMISFSKELDKSLFLKTQATSQNEELLLTNDAKLYQLTNDYKLTLKKQIKVRNRIEGFLVDSATNTIFLGSNLVKMLNKETFRQTSEFKASAVKDFLLKDDGLMIATSSGLYNYGLTSQTINKSLNQQRLRGLFLQNDKVYCYSASKLWLVNSRGESELLLDGLNIEKVVFDNRQTYVLTTTGAIFRYTDDELRLVLEVGADYADIFLTKNYLFAVNSERADVFGLKTLKKESSFFNSKGINTNKLIAVKEHKGALHFLHQQFLSVFFELPTKNKVKPNIKLLNRSALPKNLTAINYTNNDLSFEFGVYPNISAQGKAQVSYRINGLNKDWQRLYPINGTYSIPMLNLADGNYELELIAKNEDGVQSESFVLPFAIKPPFWRQDTTLLLYILILGALIWLSFYFYRLRLVRRNKMALEKVRLNNQLATAELKAIRSQMNPHFLFNAMATIQNAILKKDLKDSLDGLSSLSKLLRDVLHKSSMEMHSVQAEIDFLHNYLKLSKKRFGDDFEYKIVCEPAIDTQFEKIPTLITQPFVENAIEHGVSKRKGAKNVIVKFSSINKGYRVVIKDNGLGSDPATWDDNGKDSFALKAIKNRIARVNELNKLKVTCDINSGNEGTSVTLTFWYEQ